MPAENVPVTSLDGPLGQNLPSGPAPAPAQRQPAQQTRNQSAKPVKALRPSEFSSLLSNGPDAFDMDAPPDDASLGGSGADHTQARVDEVARRPKKNLEQDPDVDTEVGLEETPEDDQSLEQEPEAGPEEFDEFGNRIDRTAETRQRQEWADKLADGLAKGQIPHDLLKDIPVEVPINGRMVQVPFEEMRLGYMRQADYSRSKNEALALTDRSQHIINLEAQRRQEWRDPRILQRDLRGMVGDDVLLETARLVAREWADFKALSPGEQQLHLERQRIAQERAQIQQQQEMIRQQTQRQTMDQATAAAAQLINDYMPRALKAQGVGMYPRSRDLFFQNIAAFCADGDITPARAKDAAIAVRQQLEDERASVSRQKTGRPVVPGGAKPATQQDQTRRGSGQQPDVIRNSRGGGGLPRSSTGQVGMRPSDIREKYGY